MSTLQFKLSYHISRNWGISITCSLITNAIERFYGNQLRMALELIPSIYYVNDQGYGAALNTSFILAEESNILAFFSLLKQTPHLSAIISLKESEQQRVQQYLIKIRYKPVYSIIIMHLSMHT